MRRLSLLISVLATATFALAPAAEAAKKPAKPKITRVTPMRVQVGETLVIRGRNFKVKPRASTVVFVAGNGRSVFVKPKRASKRKLVLKVTGAVGRLLNVKDGFQRPTRLKLRVLAGRFSNFTPRRLSPVVISINGVPPGSPGGPKPGGAKSPAAACNSDADHDNDLLGNQLELQIKTDPCKLDTDGDGVEDGYEYKSAKDLNDDEFQDPNTSLPYPGKRPYPNALDPSDAGLDFDGDVLTLREEQRLWRYAVAGGRANRTLSPLYYSDGEQYSINEFDANNRRRPTLAATGYERHVNFLGWASINGYRTVELSDGAPWWDHGTTRNSYGLLDMNRSGSETVALQPGYAATETTYYDFDLDDFLSDDERDEDADGLTNYDEAHGRMTPEWWAACYAAESPYTVGVSGTEVDDPDTDGDGVRDGADDSDHDDVPNVMELSRLAASGLWDAQRLCVPVEGLPTPPETNHPDAYGRVNPFNPCLPAAWSRSCPRHPPFDEAPAPFDNSLDWASLN